MTEGDPGAAAGELPPRPRIRASLARLASAGVGLLSTRAELLSVELAVERERLTQRLVLVAAGGMILAFGAMFAGAFVITLFWDTHRLWAIALVAIAHVVAGGYLLSRAKAIGHDSPAPFAASIAELTKDRDVLDRALRAGEDRP